MVIQPSSKRRNILEYNKTMAETKHDDNQVPVVMGVLNTDGATPKRIYADPSTHVMQVSDGSSGSDAGKDLAARDNGGNTTLIATDASGNLINLYVDSSGNLLIKTS